MPVTNSITRASKQDSTSLTSNAPIHWKIHQRRTRLDVGDQIKRETKRFCWFWHKDYEKCRYFLCRVNRYILPVLLQHDGD